MSKSAGVACFLLAAVAAPLVHAQAPVYKVDPFWPKPLPNKWAMEQIVEVEVDKQDHVWIINRPDPKPDEMGASTTPPRAECCVVGPELIEFDAAGNVINSISSKGIEGWPQHLQSLQVDKEGNLWVSGTGTGDSIIKLSPQGKVLWDFGHRAPKAEAAHGGGNAAPAAPAAAGGGRGEGGAAAPAAANAARGGGGGGGNRQNNQQTDTLNGIGAFALDEEAQEIYVADGFVNKRILVYDMKTGAFKRGWGGHGVPLSEINNDPTPAYDINGLPPDQQEFAPILHCVVLSKDGIVYVCERGADRVSAYTKQGKFVNSFFVHPTTQARGAHCGGPYGTADGPCGTVFHLALSTDPQQKYVLVADGTNNMVWVHDRKTGALVTSFGGNGRYAGQLHWIDAIIVDSKGNVYTGEVEDGKRVQKFVLTNPTK